MQKAKHHIGAAAESSDDDLDVVEPSLEVAAAYDFDAVFEQQNVNDQKKKTSNSNNGHAAPTTTSPTKEKSDSANGRHDSKIVLLKTSNKKFEIEYSTDSVADKKKRLAERLQKGDELMEYDSFRQRSANGSMRQVPNRPTPDSECPPSEASTPTKSKNWPSPEAKKAKEVTTPTKENGAARPLRASRDVETQPSTVQASREKALPALSNSPKKQSTDSQRKSIPSAPPMTEKAVVEKKPVVLPSKAERPSSALKSSSHRIPKFMLRNGERGYRAFSSSSEDEDDLTLEPPPPPTQVRALESGEKDNASSSSHGKSPNGTKAADTPAGASAVTRPPPPPFTTFIKPRPPSGEKKGTPRGNEASNTKNGKKLSNDEAKRLIIAQKASHNANKFKHFTMQDIQKYIEKHNNQLPERDLELLRQQFEFLVEQRLRDDVDYSIDHQSVDEDDWIDDFRNNYALQHKEMAAFINTQRPARETRSSSLRNPLTTPTEGAGRSLSTLSTTTLGGGGPLALPRTKRYAPKEWEEVAATITKNITALKNKDVIGVMLKDKLKNSFTRRRSSSFADADDTMETSGVMSLHTGADGDGGTSADAYAPSNITRQLYKRYPGFGTKLFGLVPNFMDVAEANSSFRRDMDSSMLSNGGYGSGDDAKGEGETGSMSSVMTRKPSHPTLFRRLSSRLSSGGMSKLFKRKDSFRSRQEGEHPPAEEPMYGFLSSDEVSNTSHTTPQTPQRHAKSKKTFRGRAKSTGMEAGGTTPTKTVLPTLVEVPKDQTRSAPLCSVTVATHSGSSSGAATAPAPATSVSSSPRVSRGAVPRPQPHLNGAPLKAKPPYSTSAAAAKKERRVHNAVCGSSFMYTHFDHHALEGIRQVQRKSTLIRSPIWNSLGD